MRVFVLLVALMFSSEIYAAKTLLTGEKFVSEIESGEMVKMMHALGYFHAVEDGLEAQGRTCRPPSETTKATMDGAIGFIQSSESASRTPAIIMLIDYLTKTYPCDASPAQK